MPVIEFPRIVPAFLRNFIGDGSPASGTPGDVSKVGHDRSVLKFGRFLAQRRTSTILKLFFVDVRPAYGGKLQAVDEQ